MKLTPNLILVICGLVGVIQGRSATITWDGGGGDFAWQNAANWSGDALPGLNDDVIINVVSNVTIVSSASVTIQSLQCSNNLALSAVTFRVISGSSLVQGQIIASGNPMLSATGALTSFTVAGAVNADGTRFEATGGATLSLPQMTAYSKGAGCLTVTWQATGAGSMLNFPGLATITGAACASLNVQALSGGKVMLTNLTTVNDGVLSFLADGDGSQVDLPMFQQSLATSRVVSLEARNRGTVSVPVLTGGAMVTVALSSGGVIPVAQLRQLNGFTVTGMAVEFAALTNLNGGNISVTGGAVVETPGLLSLTPTGCLASTWLVTGTNSVWNLSRLTNLGGPSCGFINLQATAGGTMVLSNLSTIVDGTLDFLADGTNSLMDLGALQQMLAASLTVSFEARNRGTVWMPLLTGGPTVRVALSSGGVLPVGQLKRLNGFNVAGMAVEFPALTNLAGGDITVDAGAIVTAPNFASHSQTIGCFGTTWLVTGAGSVLDLSHLTDLNGAGCGELKVQAEAGGTLILSNLAVISEGTVNFLADGANTRVDLGALQQCMATQRSLSFEARNNGTVWMPQFPGGPTVAVTLKSGGVLPVGQLRQLSGFAVSGMTVGFPGLTNLTGGNLTVDGGAVVTASNLTSHSQSIGCSGNKWLASGAGSVLDLSHLASLDGAGCGLFNVQAMAGGTLILSNLTAISEGTLAFLADGTNSLVDLRTLQQSLAALRTVSFEVRNAGTILLPLMTGGPTVDVTIKTNGVMSVAAMGRLSGIAVSGKTVNFPALTNFDSGFFSVANAAAVTATNLRTYVQGTTCGPDAWMVGGAGSVLDLSGITQITGGTCAWLDAQALNGGHLLLGNLTNILSGTVYFLTSGTGSLIDLHSLINYLNSLKLSRLTATNSGTFLLDEQPFLLSGVTVSFAAGTPGLSQTSLGATNAFLHGNPWHSYWVESRIPASPANPWDLFQRVPLTNDFQIIGPVAPANTEFRVTEFVADPFALELTAFSGAGVNVVLYGPTNHRFDVLATTNLVLAGPWPTTNTVFMTNTFRILPPEPVATTRRFFKVNPR